MLKRKALVCVCLFLLLLLIGWQLNGRMQERPSPSTEGLYTIRSVPPNPAPDGGEPFGPREYVRIVGWSADGP
ncbi:MULTISPECIES: hypothetical protein [Cohnella]|jgi:hypothetical protein|uniref:hypothetical protein n=1 Tax=Cohnella TaxID=329857 RepID=UPI000E385F3E|nr:hypothetical protein [Cohnella sp.]REK68183.1 MAG: hypothetical protein C6P35_02980 [Cohnella sp.]